MGPNVGYVKRSAGVPFHLPPIHDGTPALRWTYPTEESSDSLRRQDDLAFLRFCDADIRLSSLWQLLFASTLS
ncbi:MAG: hypothetical protein ACI8P0_005347, partial [Planctomycetaceae bacterium]